MASLLGTQAVTGAEAVQISLTAARSPAVLHLATHGFFLPGPEPLPVGDHYKTLYGITVPGEGTFLIQAERDTKTSFHNERVLVSHLVIAGR